jgi:glycosyltransferase involved in cell wall biosynthesis
MATVHDVFHLAHPDVYSRPQRAFARLLYRNALWRSDAVVAVSEFTRKEILRFFPWAEAKVRVVPNGADPYFAEGTSAERIPGPYLLYVGNVKPHKNLKLALAAFTKIAQRYPDVTFRIVGRKDGFVKGDEGLINDLPETVRARVIFTGHLDSPALKSHYRDAACLVLPSLYEGFGLPLLEAMAFGIPIASSNRASLPEVGGDAILFFDPTDTEEVEAALISVLEGHWKPDLGAYRERIQQFSWDSAANGYLEAFRKSVQA